MYCGTVVLIFDLKKKIEENILLLGFVLIGGIRLLYLVTVLSST